MTDPQIARQTDSQAATDAPVAAVGIRIRRDPTWIAEHIETIFKTVRGPFAGRVDPYVYVNHAVDGECPNLHAHISTPVYPEGAAAQIQSYRDRIKALGVSKCEYAIRTYPKGFAGFCFYVKHQEPHPELHNATPEQTAIYAASKAYDKHPVPSNREEDPVETHINDVKVRTKLLSEATLIPVMNHFCRQQRIAHRRFSEVFDRLVQETQWKIGPGLCADLYEVNKALFENGRATCGPTQRNKYKSGIGRRW